MEWQEYQAAVAILYEQAEGIGVVRRNVLLPDKVTGQMRQIDVLIELEAKGHPISILVDAKFRKGKLDIKDIDGVLALADAVNASKSVIVAANGWTGPAETKAKFCNMDLLLLSVDEALDLVVEDKWQLCPGCEADCIVMDHGGFLEVDGAISVYLAGQCRACRLAFLWCWSCGDEGHMPPSVSYECNCGHIWSCSQDGMRVQIAGTDEIIDI
jgi:hypothetical protein